MQINGGTGISLTVPLLDVAPCAEAFFDPFSMLFRSFNLEANAFAVIGLTGEPVCVMDDWLSLKYDRLLDAFE